MDPAEAAERAVRAVREGKTQSVDGNDVAVRADAICVHSDTPNAVDSGASPSATPSSPGSKRHETGIAGQGS